MARRIFKIIGIVILAVVVLMAALLLWLTSTEYKPAAVENVDVAAAATTGVQPTVGDSISVLSWNIGYAGLGKGSDFFMDGGKNSRSADETTVNTYLSGIADTLKAAGADVYMLQEVDQNSSRTFH